MWLAWKSYRSCCTAFPGCRRLDLTCSLGHVYSRSPSLKNALRSCGHKQSMQHHAVGPPHSACYRRTQQHAYAVGNQARRITTASSTAHTSAAGLAGGHHGNSTGDGHSEPETLGSLKRRVGDVRTRVEAVLAVADLPAMKAELAVKEDDASQSDVWGDPVQAQVLLTRVNTLRAELSTLSGFQAQLEDASFAIELIEATQGDGDKAEADTLLREAVHTVSQLESGLERWEERRLLGGLYDDRSARLTITTGAGGVDAQDWSEILERMYLRWASAAGFSVTTVDRSVGDEAGIKHCELLIEGRYAYGYLRSEKGTHRLVRNSPFNAKGLRQTSFSGVEVVPVLGEADLVDPALAEINESDLSITFQRASGAGGQNVNKVETGVRITHVPTGLSVKCTQERSQVQNRAIAMAMLKSKLAVVLEEQAAKKVAEIRGDVVKAEWGQQIRNYVLHPYKLVKDTRTGHETSDVSSVLEGTGLNPFITAYLRHKASGGANSQ